MHTYMDANLTLSNNYEAQYIPPVNHYPAGWLHVANRAMIYIALLGLPCAISANEGFVLIADRHSISLQANNASLKEIFIELESQTGILVSFELYPQERVTIELVDQPFLSAISKLAPNHLVVNSASNGLIVVAELIIISDSPDQPVAQSSTDYLPGSQSIVETVDPDDLPESTLDIHVQGVEGSDNPLPQDDSSAEWKQ